MPLPFFDELHYDIDNNMLITEATNAYLEDEKKNDDTSLFEEQVPNIIFHSSLNKLNKWNIIEYENYSFQYQLNLQCV